MKRIIFHSFALGDVEDPELYAAQPLCEFMKTPKGVWISENCKDVQYRTTQDFSIMGYRIQVYGNIEDILATEYYLRWSHD